MNRGLLLKSPLFPPGGEELPYEKDGGSGQKFKKKNLRGTNILFCGSDLKFCHIFFTDMYPKTF